MKFLFLILISFNVMSQDLPVCLEHQSNQEFLGLLSLQNNVEEVSEHLSSSSDTSTALANDVRRTTCNRNPSVESYIRSIESTARSRTRSTTNRLRTMRSHGVNFENEHSSLIALFGVMMTRITPNGRTRVNMRSRCKKVICAVKEKFGDSRGPKLLYILQKFGLNGSHITYTPSQAWSERELDHVLRGLNDLPPGFLPTDERIKPLTRYPSGCVNPDHYYGPSKCVKAISNIEFYDCLWDQPSPGLNATATTVHEVGHRVHFNMSYWSLRRWKNLSGWTEQTRYVTKRRPTGRVTPLTRYSRGCHRPRSDGGSYSGSYETVRERVTEEVHDDNACFISDYSKSNWKEDFADTFRAYRYDANRLKRTCPRKYNYMRDHVFEGIEFTNSGAFCRNRPRFNR